MRLSEAFMLGITTCKLEMRNLDSCAYGCALNAMGVPQTGIPVLEQRYEVKAVRDRWQKVYELWPWTKPVDSDWACVSVLASEVWMKFDFDVCQGNMTLEQLHDYIKSIEPDCDCNRFDCNCKESQPESGVSHATSRHSETTINAR